MKVMKIGVMPREEFMARTIAIARGDFKPAADDPKVYMESLSCVAQLLSNENLKVLKLIQETNPTSLQGNRGSDWPIYTEPVENG